MNAALPLRHYHYGLEANTGWLAGLLVGCLPACKKSGREDSEEEGRERDRQREREREREKREEGINGSPEDCSFPGKGDHGCSRSSLVNTLGAAAAPFHIPLLLHSSIHSATILCLHASLEMVHLA